MRDRIEYAELAPLLRRSLNERLSAEDERALMVKAKAGVAVARDEVVRRNIRFVVSLASSNHAPGMRLEDLVQEGLFGLLKALEKFEVDRGLRFTTYASWWIKAYVGRSARQARSQPGAAQRLDREESEERHSLEALLVDGGESPAEVVARDELRASVRRELRRIESELRPLERSLLRDRLMSDTPRTLQAVGHDVGLSRERVRQVEMEMRQRLGRELARLRLDLDEAA